MVQNLSLLIFTFRVGFLPSDLVGGLSLLVDFLVNKPLEMYQNCDLLKKRSVISYV